ncbi:MULTISPECIES: hypothetical protein [Symbiopectobacterium]|uniref:hypothetical protein n=1 Tax=Symbiopectobacterium TaxID=801 RepID=UPI0020794EA1|nr:MULTISPECIES: hypothetical protein [Symbiopectobacterium]
MWTDVQRPYLQALHHRTRGFSACHDKMIESALGQRQRQCGKKKASTAALACLAP